MGKTYIYVYDAWGNHKVLNPDGTENTNSTFIGNINPLRYRGYYYDADLGLYYLMTRYYDPEIGRFISADGIEYLDPESLGGLNLFAYCNNNPVMGVDSDGTWSWRRFGMIVAAVAITVAVAAVVAVTAGVAVGGIAAAGVASSAATNIAITTGVCAFAGGVTAGLMDITTQTVINESETLDLGSVAIEAFTGSAYGATSGVIMTAPIPGMQIGARWARVAISGLRTVLHGINNGDSVGDIANDAASSMAMSAGAQLFFGGRACLNGYFDPVKLGTYALAGNLELTAGGLMMTMFIAAKNGASREISSAMHWLWQRLGL